MSATNCVNCGCAKDPEATKCPHCGTTYFDITAIDFDSGKPIALTCIMPGSKQKATMLAIPYMNEISITSHPRYETLTDAHSRRCFMDEQELVLQCQFTAVYQPDGTLFKVWEGDGK